MKSSLRALLLRLRFSRKEAVQGVGLALLFSAPLYLAWMHMAHPLVDSIIALVVFYCLLVARQGTLLAAGLSVGILWFYWVGFSFRFVDMSYVVPLVPLAFALVYGALFWVIGFTHHLMLRALLWWLSSYYHPFYFNWFKPELLLVDSYFGVQRWHYAWILVVLVLMIYYKKHKISYAFGLLLLGAVSWNTPPKSLIEERVKVTQTHFDQHTKWKPSHRTHYLAQNFHLINQAILEGKELVILPESTFPLFLNRHPDVLNRLLALSHNIAIIAGALLVEGEATFNATYFFNEGQYQVAKKMVLVPFGEYIPLPAWIRNWINDLIFQGGADFHTASAPTDFKLNDKILRNAICYEASTELFYKDNPAFIVATSNNAWFTPSIEPVLQKKLISLFAKRHGTTVLHSVNGSAAEIIYP